MVTPKMLIDSPATSTICTTPSPPEKTAQAEVRQVLHPRYLAVLNYWMDRHYFDSRRSESVSLHGKTRLGMAWPPVDGFVERGQLAHYSVSSTTTKEKWMVIF